MAKPITVKECMRHHPITVSSSDSLVTAIEIIVENKLTGLTVTDGDNNVLGVITDLDCVGAILSAIYNDGNPLHTQVGDIMIVDINSCEPQDTIIEVAESMLKHRQRRRPVLEGDKLVGQVSSGNILWALLEHSRGSSAA